MYFLGTIISGALVFIFIKTYLVPEIWMNSVHKSPAPAQNALSKDYSWNVHIVARATYPGEYIATPTVTLSISWGIYL